MIFSELYSVYYNTVAEILKAAQKGADRRELDKIIREQAFSESVLTIMPNLKSGRWQLFDKDLRPLIKNPPTMPLTTLQKRWLKAVLSDKRLRLFDLDEKSFAGLSEIKPLFTADDFRIYDRYGDGDDYEDEGYVRRFRLILTAIKENRPVFARIKTRSGGQLGIRFYPQKIEYSAKDDKFRILADRCRYRYFNMANITAVIFADKNLPYKQKPKADKKCELTLEITDERNALERAMMHFAHFEKQAFRSEENKYILKLCYCKSDETELVIRVLSFGPLIKVLYPDEFAELIRERLRRQFEFDNTPNGGRK